MKLMMLFNLLLFLTLAGCNQSPNKKTAAEAGDTNQLSVGLHSPLNSTGTSARPTIRISGVTPSSTVSLYTTSNCSPSSLVGSAVAVGTNIDIQVDPAAALTDGEYSFYASSEDSACSSSSTSYKKVTCPSNYLFVPRNSTVGSGDFCVMKYEAKDVSGTPTSTSTQLPWVNISDQDALDACQSLSSGSASYDLISNSEWMAVAREIEANSNNRDSGRINSGHSDNDPSALLSVTDSSDPWSDTSSAGDFGQKRTHLLASGEEIWDFSGNAWEIVDWNVETPTNTLITVPNPSCTIGWTEIATGLSLCSGVTRNQVGPLDSSLTSSNGVGKMIGGATTGAVRGGNFNHFGHDYIGIYSLGLEHNANNPEGDIGFRCVLRF